MSKEAMEKALQALDDACLSRSVYGEQPPQLYLDAAESLRAALAAQSASVSLR